MEERLRSLRRRNLPVSADSNYVRRLLEETETGILEINVVQPSGFGLKLYEVDAFMDKNVFLAIESAVRVSE